MISDRFIILDIGGFGLGIYEDEGSYLSILIMFMFFLNVVDIGVLVLFELGRVRGFRIRSYYGLKFVSGVRVVWRFCREVSDRFVVIISI